MLFGLVFMMIRCLIFSASCYAAWPSLPHDAWCLLHHVILFDLVFVFFTLLDLLYIKPHRLPLTKPCFAAWSSLYHVRLPDLVFMMLGCLVLSTSCCAASPSLPHVKLLDVVYIRLWNLICSSWFMMLGCLVFSMSCYAAGPSHLMSGCLMSPKSCYAFKFLIHAARCCIVWSYPPHATTTRPTSCCLVFSTSDLWFLIVWSCLGDATLFDLDYLMLRCLMSPTSGCAFWSGLHGARLLDLLRLMLPLDLPCLSLRHVKLLDLLWIMLCYPIWSS